MGQLFTRISTERSDLQTSSIITPNNFVAMQPVMTKRKYIDQNMIAKKRKILLNTYSNSAACLILSSRISKSAKPFIINRSSIPTTIFKCQLCYHCFASKDSYLDHMIICAIEHQAPVKIVRAKKLIHLRHEE
ncbi:unnamed protein product [Rotaria magnacalcarata]|uniref:Uncharacterized protein n=1 Tax=Rotaria magnacalcarata TaxID=392030 RepID=A0A819YBT7_9BILA|nr:unnamed protein product [Rotaria magnacalcarata]CAF2172484.1 unnamed protein product [Rotaria magnacalcarata]CAF3899484.1 unnamed protein product [Rotaria magnacalcarata]CAF4150579.1 unnamed protein product [Rotaria magnacalcarata]